MAALYRCKFVMFMVSIVSFVLLIYVDLSLTNGLGTFLPCSWRYRLELLVPLVLYHPKKIAVNTMALQSWIVLIVLLPKEQVQRAL